MKKIILFTSLFSMLFLSESCQKEDDLYVPESLQVNNFIWKGLNLYYLWQADVPNLDDNRFANQSELNNFLSGYSNPVTLFNNLRIDPTIDRFSVIFSDYTVLEGILSGNTTDNGMDYGLRYVSGNSGPVFGWVRYVIPNSDAASKNVLRGQLFYAINGTPLTVSNYVSLLSNETYTINLADYDNGNITPNGQSITLTKSAISENPVYRNAAFDVGTRKVGYLMYNGFYSGYESQLNDAFGQLQSQGVTDLVLDLRYNSGGSIATATRLASMITGQFTGQLFARQQWNSKLENYWSNNNPSQFVNNFTSTLGNGSAINSLHLNKIYILTSKSTASASELVINGLKPYIQVVQIGDKTTGKNVGSVTLYDSPNFSKTNINPNHKYAMQPIVIKTVNAAGFGDYQLGLSPEESNKFIENLGNMGELGTATEPMLAFTLNLISNGGKISNQNNVKKFEYCSDSKNINPLRSEMYVELK